MDDHHSATALKEWNLKKRIETFYPHRKTGKVPHKYSTFTLLEGNRYSLSILHYITVPSSVPIICISLTSVVHNCITELNCFICRIWKSAVKHIILYCNHHMQLPIYISLPVALYVMPFYVLMQMNNQRQFLMLHWILIKRLLVISIHRRKVPSKESRMLITNRTATRWIGAQMC